MIGCDDAFYEELFEECTQLMGAIRRMPQPVIAQVHGVATAVGRKRAMQMLLTGELIDAATALEWGLINEVVAPEDLDAATSALAAKITGASPRVVGLGKETFYAQVERDEEAAYELTKPVMSRNASTPDAQEGIGAFVAKRAPVWPAG